MDCLFQIFFSRQQTQRNRLPEHHLMFLLSQDSMSLVLYYLGVQVQPERLQEDLVALHNLIEIEQLKTDHFVST